MSTGRRAGLSPELIVEGALQLAETKGIDGWSVRDVAQRLGVVPSVIYHYYPNKEALCDAVVDRACSEIRLPDDSLRWNEWWKNMALTIRPVLLRYVGITDRLARGKFTSAFLPMVDSGMNKLFEAGFSKNTPLVYSILVNTIIHAIGARNLRSERQQHNRHDMGEMLQRFAGLKGESVALNYMVDNFFEPLSRADHEDEISQKYYETVIDVVLTGIEEVFLSSRGRH